MANGQWPFVHLVPKRFPARVHHVFIACLPRAPTRPSRAIIVLSIAIALDESHFEQHPECSNGQLFVLLFPILWNCAIPVHFDPISIPFLLNAWTSIMKSLTPNWPSPHQWPPSSDLVHYVQHRHPSILIFMLSELTWIFQCVCSNVWNQSHWCWNKWTQPINGLTFFSGPFLNSLPCSNKAKYNFPDNLLGLVPLHAKCRSAKKKVSLPANNVAKDSAQFLLQPVQVTMSQMCLNGWKLWIPVAMMSHSHLNTFEVL